MYGSTENISCYDVEFSISIYCQSELTRCKNSFYSRSLKGAIFKADCFGKKCSTLTLSTAKYDKCIIEFFLIKMFVLSDQLIQHCQHRKQKPKRTKKSYKKYGLH